MKSTESRHTSQSLGASDRAEAPPADLQLLPTRALSIMLRPIDQNEHP